MADSEDTLQLLRQAQALLSRGFPDLDQWRSVWMMLVGARYLLGRAEPFLVGPDRLDLDAAEAFANQLLSDALPPESEWCDKFRPHPWISGFYILSAEHRIANSVDRLTKVFAGANVSRIPDGKQMSPYPRCKFLASSCPHCQGPGYAGHVQEARTILKKFSEAKDVEWPDLCLGRVYKRVNELKHQPEPGRSRDATVARSSDATEALREVSLVLSQLALHRTRCSNFRTLPQ